uniref:Uncharacterized protein n=1 Tax=Aegilops tauschii subsp. strangulata TaxID=200361 RepID=A0A453EIQ3_AEGTS
TMPNMRMVYGMVLAVAEGDAVHRAWGRSVWSGLAGRMRGRQKRRLGPSFASPARKPSPSVWCDPGFPSLQTRARARARSHHPHPRPETDRLLPFLHLTSPFFSPTTGDCTTTTDCSPSALPPTSPATGGARTDGAGEGSAVCSSDSLLLCSALFSSLIVLVCSLLSSVPRHGSILF